MIWKPGINWQTLSVSNLRLNAWVWHGLKTADVCWITRLVTSEWNLLHIRCWLAPVRYISEVCNLHNCQRGTCRCLALSLRSNFLFFFLKWNRSKQEHQRASSKGRNTKNRPQIIKSYMYVFTPALPLFWAVQSMVCLFVCFFGGFGFLVFYSRSKTKNSE